MNHLDCTCYLAVDVFYGLCKRTRETISADDPGCEKAETAAKCKHCRHYSETEHFLGLCMGKTMTYPDLNAITCAHFSWSKKKP